MLNLKKELKREKAATKHTILHYLNKYRKLKHNSYLDISKHNLSELKKLNNLDIDELITIVKSLLEAYVPNNYDIQDDCVLIHYPEVELTNSNGKKHMIYDMYIKFNFKLKHGKLALYYSALRMKLSYLEKMSDYGHSHINGSSKDWSSSFCFGSSIYFSEDVLRKFETLLIILPDFLATESTNTTPYKLIKSIGAGRNKISPRTNYRFAPITKITFDINISKYLDTDVIVPIDNHLLDNYLIDVYGNSCLCYCFNNEYYWDMDCGSNYSKSNISFVYKGKTITQEIFYPDNIEKPEKIINPYFKQNFIKYAIQQFSEAAFTIGGIEWPNTSTHITEPVEQDTISVQ